MKVLIVYCHPSKTSFTHQIYTNFAKGLNEAGHDVVCSDLYEMDFQTDITEEEYLRETYYRTDIAVRDDVKAEQEKIESCDAIAFIYPVFWTEAPAKLVGWFDRVWSSGFAYGPNQKMQQKEKVLVIACAGKTIASLSDTGEAKAMETVMLGDRIRERAKEKQMIVFDGITHWDEKLREELSPVHLQKAYQLGKEF